METDQLLKLSSSHKREIVRNDYNAIGKEYAKSYSQIDYCKSYIDKFIKSLSGGGILDVGCGAGQFTNYFCELGFKAKGIDFSTTLLDIARQNYPNVEFEYADICEYETYERYDGIFVKDVLFHLPDEDIVKALKVFKKILKPNGKICIIMDLPKKAGEHIFVEELNDQFKIYYNYLTPAKLQAFLEKEKIVVDNIEIIQENDNASSYAEGLMVVQATNVKKSIKEK